MFDSTTTRFQRYTEQTQQQIEMLTERIRELMELLHRQREFLQSTRGINVPDDSVVKLKEIHQQIEVLATEVISWQMELNQLRELARTTSLINSSLEVDEVLEKVMDTVIRLTGAERGYIVLKNKDTAEMEFRVARGMGREHLSRDEFTVSRTIVNDVWTNGEPVLSDNASQDTRYAGNESVVGFALRSLLAAPLKIRDEVIGVVYCDNRIMSGLFKQHELNLMTAFANQAAVAIQNARLFEATRKRLAEVTEVRDLMDNIFASITSCILTIDERNIITTCNAAGGTIIGLELDAIIGKSVDDILPDVVSTLENQSVLEIVESVRGTGEQYATTAEPVRNGRKHYWNIIASPLRTDDDLSRDVTVVLDDLTELKETQEQLEAVRIYLPGALVDNIRSIDVSAVGGEERDISAIFADVRGFTSFSEELEPEELLKVINKYLSVASDAINLFEGIVDKYMGDAVTGLFNTQLNPQEDHAVRAVRAAMAIIFDLHALHEVLPEEQRLFYGIGIHSGTAVLGNVGGESRKEFSALGDAMDVSKVLQENADKGEIIISEATYELVQDHFNCVQIEPRKTKGYDDLVMYRVEGRRRGRNSATGLLTGF